MWLAVNTGGLVVGVETVMSGHLKTGHQPKTATLVYRPNAEHYECGRTRTSPEGISSGQAGYARRLTTTPDGLESLTWMVKQHLESTAAWYKVVPPSYVELREIISSVN